MGADELYEQISIAISQSLCSTFEVVGILEMAKQELLLNALEADDEEGEGFHEVLGE
jgi:hypothetical protein